MIISRSQSASTSVEVLPSQNLEPSVPITAPATESQEAHLQRSYAHDATVVLVGGRGTGKSSLAVIASTFLQRPCIDADDYFRQKTGISRTQYKERDGATNYARLEPRIMQSMLSTHSTGYVIVCGPSAISNHGRQLLMKYAETHPVVHILRGIESALRYLGIADHALFTRLHDRSELFFRSVANCEFYNLSEEFEALGAGDSWHETSGGFAKMRRFEYPFLRLKGVEAEFIRFLRITFKESRSQQHQISSGDRYDLASILRSSHTYVLSLSLSELQARVVTEEGFNCGADAFELKVDLLCHDEEGVSSVPASLLEEISRLVAIVRRYFDGPIIYHVETPSDRPVRAISVTRSIAEDGLRYLELLKHGLRLAPEFITVNLKWVNQDVLNLLGTRRGIRLISHFHDQIPGSGGWDSHSRHATYNRALSMRCDMVRLTQPATCTEDNFDVLRFVNYISQTKAADGTSPYLIAYNTGVLGRISCCFNKIFTPVYSQEVQENAAFFSSRDLIPSLTLQQAQHSLYSCFLHNSLKFWIVGNDVSYSLSPAMHNAAHRSCGLPHQFGICQISSITELQDLAKDPYLGGCSIAQGYRVSVLPLLHSMSSHAKALGAVNTLIPIRSSWDPASPPPLSFYHQRNQAGAVIGLYGDNTDWVGIQRCVRQYLSPANVICQESTSLVIGAGAVARASIYALIRLGVPKILIWNRTPENGTALAEHFNRLQSSEDLAKISDAPTKAQETTAHNIRRSNVEFINSLDHEWPLGYRQPTIIVSCVPGRANITLSTKWLKSPTGGVMIDVSLRSSFPAKFQLTNLFIAGIQTSTHTFVDADTQSCTERLGGS